MKEQTWGYHVDCREGRIFEIDREAKETLPAGWVDTPAKLPPVTTEAPASSAPALGDLTAEERGALIAFAKAGVPRIVALEKFSAEAADKIAALETAKGGDGAPTDLSALTAQVAELAAKVEALGAKKPKGKKGADQAGGDK